jgi:hypothetical protein
VNAPAHPSTTKGYGRPPSEEVSIGSLNAGNSGDPLKELHAQIRDIQAKLESLTKRVETTRRQVRDLLWQTREQLQGIYDLEAGLARPVQPGGPISRGRAEDGASFSQQTRGYGDLVDRIRNLVSNAARPGSTVIVVSRGDEQLLEFDTSQGWHFPQAANGVYAGFHPRDSKEAIQHLEELRSRGGNYFLIPATSAWWLDFYREFRDHLESHYCVVARERDAGILYSFGGDQ